MAKCLFRLIVLRRVRIQERHLAISNSSVKRGGLSSPLRCVWALDIFLGKLDDAEGQSDARTADVTLVTAVSCGACNFEVCVMAFCC